MKYVWEIKLFDLLNKWLVFVLIDCSTDWLKYVWMNKLMISVLINWSPDWLLEE